MKEQGTSKGRILIADDDEAFRITTRAFLNRQGYECEVASDGATAVAMLQASDFDLLISDIHMPGNVGLELVEKLPEVAAALPVVVLTGHPSVQTAARSVRLQVVAYLVKPCDSDELLSIADQAIANYRAYRAVSANRQMLEKWASDLAQIEEVLRSSPGSASAAPTESYINLTLTNLLSVLLDLKHFTEALAHSSGKDRLLEQVTLHRALHDTIEVLEKTKQSFKSKELGELRRRLQALLHTPSTGDMKKDI